MPIIQDMATGRVLGIGPRQSPSIFDDAEALTGVGSRVLGVDAQRQQMELAQRQQALREQQTEFDQFDAMTDNARAVDELGMRRQQFDVNQRNIMEDNARADQTAAMSRAEFEWRKNEAMRKAAEERAVNEAMAAALGGSPEWQGAPFQIPQAGGPAYANARLPAAEQLKLAANQRILDYQREQQRLAQERLQMTGEQNQIKNTQQERRIGISEKNAANYSANTANAQANRTAAKKIEAYKINLAKAQKDMESSDEATKQAGAQAAEYWLGKINEAGSVEPMPAPAQPEKAKRGGLLSWLFGSGESKKTPDQLADEAIARGITDPNQIKEYIRRGGQ